MPLTLLRPPALASSRHAFRSTLARAAALAAFGIAAAIGTSGAAFAQIAKNTTDGTPQVDASIANKDWNAALKQLDARLVTNPQDAQAKFKRATVLARLNRDDEAITAFTELTQTYPELPEPYNNLAALYAKKGRYEEARAALETAVKANPGYTLAYDNLGDLYLRLASESYKRAQSLGSTSPLTRQRVTAIQNIITPPLVKRGVAASGARAASAPQPASGDWAPTRDSNTSAMPSPDTYSPFGGSTGSLPGEPYMAPYVAPATQNSQP